MKTRSWLAVILPAILFIACSKTVDCTEKQIHPGFIGFQPAEINSFILRKFSAGSNFQSLLDTFQVRSGVYSEYLVYHDTTIVNLTDGINGVKAGYDWQIYVPAANKTILITGIVAEKNSTSCNNGLFSSGRFRCSCTNPVHSAKVDGQTILFTNSGNSEPVIYIPR